VTLAAYRIAKRRYESTMWTGAGARDHGARWSSRGVAVVYTADSRSLAALERLVHLVQPRILSGFVIARITFDDTRVERIDPSTLPAQWNAPVAPAALRKYGDNWVAARWFPVLAVPSVLTSGEWNYLFNPEHPEFAALPKSELGRFVNDRRLA